MKQIEKRSQSVVWKSGSETGKERTKFRLTEDDGRRFVNKNMERLSEDSLWRTNVPLIESPKSEGKTILNDEGHHFFPQEDMVTLQAKKTQTKGRREEKGLQISMGRHVNRVPKVLAQTSVQTDRLALYIRLQEMFWTYKAPITFYFTALMISFISVYSSFFLVKMIRTPPPVVLPEPPPSFWIKLSSAIGQFLHNCRYCPLHR